MEQNDDGFAEGWREHLLAQAVDPALKGHKTDALALWQAVADGDFYPDVQAWLQEVAKRVLDADKANAETPKRRPDAVLMAVGLKGNVDRHRKVREALDVLTDFEIPDGVRGPTPERIAEALTADGTASHIGPDENLPRIIADMQRELKKKKKKKEKE